MSLVLVATIVGTLSFGSEFGLGADYSSQAYKTGNYDTLNWEWEEEDTLDIETEGRGFWVLDMNLSSARTTLDATNTLNLSTRSVRDQLSLRFEQQLSPAVELKASNDAEFRLYHGLFPKLADTAYTKDYLNNVARLEVRLDATENLYVNISDGVELFKYARPDSFSYDYLINRVSVDACQELGLLTSLDAEYGWSHRRAWVQDGRNYNEHNLRAGIDHYFESGFCLAGANDLTRRQYPGAEYSFWEENFTLSAGHDFTGLSLELEEDGRWTWYDSTTEVYTDLFENSIQLTAEVQPRSEMFIRFGPQYSIGLSLARSHDDDFREWSLVFGLDFFRLDRFWVSLEDRVGRRNYPYADSTFQSSYAFNELSLFLNWTVLSGSAGDLELEGMVSIAPEWHADKSENFTFGVYSLELKYGL